MIITAHGTIDRAVEAMRRGAFDFLPKPFTPAQVRAVLERVGRIRQLHRRVADLEEQVRSEVPEVVLESPRPGSSPRMLEQARRVAATDAVVLIKGESGTGKGVLARRIHGWSHRSAGPFVTVSCPSLSAELLESEMFGHVRGAFTGAIRDTSGKVAAADGGHPVPRRDRRLAAGACSPSCSASCRNAVTSGWAIPRPARPTSA